MKFIYTSSNKLPQWCWLGLTDPIDSFRVVSSSGSYVNFATRKVKCSKNVVASIILICGFIFLPRNIFDNYFVLFDSLAQCMYDNFISFWQLCYKYYFVSRLLKGYVLEIWVEILELYKNINLWRYLGRCVWKWFSRRCEFFPFAAFRSWFSSIPISMNSCSPALRHSTQCPLFHTTTAVAAAGRYKLTLFPSFRFTVSTLVPVSSQTQFDA